MSPILRTWSKPQPDVFINPKAGSESSRLLSSVFGGQKSVSLDYLAHDMPLPAEAATRDIILSAIDGLPNRVRPGDRVILYTTGHSGKGEPVANAPFFTWNNDRLAVYGFFIADF